MKMVVGLGNPGKAYERSRHNAGFEVLDELARRAETTFRKSWLVSTQAAKMRADGEDVLLVKPRTFMNRSGQAVAPMLRRKGLGVEDLIVVLDDVELDCGKIRIRKKGGAGGHNGLQSVIQALGTEDFVRVRVGVGPRPAGEHLVGHVLGPFSAEERAKMKDSMPRAADAVLAVIRDGADKAMNDFN